MDEAALADLTIWEEALGVVQVCDDEEDKERHECKLEDESLLLRPESLEDGIQKQRPLQAS